MDKLDDPVIQQIFIAIDLSDNLYTYILNII